MKKRKVLTALLLTAAVVCLGLAAWLIADNFIDHSGWIQENGTYAYLDESGDPVTGFQTIDGLTYYFSPTGAMATGFQTLNGDTYFFGQDGVRRIGLTRVEGQDYCFDSQGRMLRGFVRMGENRYYCGEDGTIQRGWLSLESGTWYLGEDGAAVTGTASIDGKEYRFDADGKQIVGWTEADGSRVYCLAEGGAATGWQELDEKIYLLDDEGRVQTGWHTEGEYTYYLTEQGAAVGPVYIDGQLHYFSPKGMELLLVNTQHKIPGSYSPSIVTFTGYHMIAEPADRALREMFDAMEAAGIKYTINSIYRTRSQQQTILTNRTEEYMSKGYSYEAAYAKARDTVALPDTSEHQLGLAADIVGTDANAWLAEHCWEYGFILRYPGNKVAITGIINEPWHFRYVGKEVSMDMKGTNLCLEEYVGAAFAFH